MLPLLLLLLLLLLFLLLLLLVVVFAAGKEADLYFQKLSNVVDPWRGQEQRLLHENHQRLRDVAARQMLLTERRVNIAQRVQALGQNLEQVSNALRRFHAILHAFQQSGQIFSQSERQQLRIPLT
jgi:predicted PurR-regulated permease PerM